MHELAGVVDAPVRGELIHADAGVDQELHSIQPEAHADEAAPQTPGAGPDLPGAPHLPSGHQKRDADGEGAQPDAHEEALEAGGRIPGEQHAREQADAGQGGENETPPHGGRHRPDRQLVGSEQQPPGRHVARHQRRSHRQEAERMQRRVLR